MASNDIVLKMPDHSPVHTVSASIPFAYSGTTIGNLSTVEENTSPDSYEDNNASVSTAESIFMKHTYLHKDDYNSKEGNLELLQVMDRSNVNDPDCRFSSGFETPNEISNASALSLIYPSDERSNFSLNSLLSEEEFGSIHNSCDNVSRFPHIRVRLRRAQLKNSFESRSLDCLDRSNISMELKTSLSSDMTDLKLGNSFSSDSKWGGKKGKRRKSTPNLSVQFSDQKDVSGPALFASRNSTKQNKNVTLKSKLFPKNKRHSIAIELTNHNDHQTIPGNRTKINMDESLRSNDNSDRESSLGDSSKNSSSSETVMLGELSDGLPTNVSLTKRPLIHENHHCTLLFNFTTVLPPDEIAENPTVIKDATDVCPLISGETIVTDILSNKAIIFDVRGHPRVSFEMDKGSDPWSTHVMNDGVMAVTLKGRGQVCLWSSRGEAISEFGHGILSAPTGIRGDHNGRYIVTDEWTNKVLLFSQTGKYLGNFTHQVDKGENSTTPNEPQNMSSPLLPNNDINFQAKSKISNKNDPEVYSSDLNKPRYLCVTKDDKVAISDSANHCIKIFNQNGTFVSSIGSFGREDGQLRFPYGVAYDEEDGCLFVSDHFNQRVSVFSPGGKFLYHVLTKQDGLERPKGLAIRGFKLYVTHGKLRSDTISVYNLRSRPHLTWQKMEAIRQQ